jgi:hypothetical protein
MEGHVACMGELRNEYNAWVQQHEEKGPLERSGRKWDDDDDNDDDDDDDDDDNDSIQFNSLLFICRVISYKSNYRHSTV